MDRSRGRRSSLTFGQLELLQVPLLEAAGDVDADAPGAKIPAADVAGYGHDDTGEVGT